MKIQTALVASLLLLLSPTAASGEYLYSEQYGFSANFPDSPTIGAATGSAKDNGGNFISTAVVVSSTKPGIDYAFVSVDSFVVEKTLDAASTFDARRDSFLKSLNATFVSSHEDSLGGYPAFYFSYEMNDHSAVGKAIILIVQAAKPRVYFVGTTYTQRATVADLAKLDKFLASFYIQ